MNSQASTEDQLARLMTLGQDKGLYNAFGLKVSPWVLVRLANEHGLYDAADAVKRVFRLDHYFQVERGRLGV